MSDQRAPLPKPRPPFARRIGALPLSQRIAAGIAIIVTVFSGGCTILLDGADLVSMVGGGNEYAGVISVGAVIFGGIPFVIAALIVRSALTRAPPSAIAPLSTGRKVAAAVGIAIMAIGPLGLSLASGGIPFTVGLLIWWLAIRVGR